MVTRCFFGDFSKGNTFFTNNSKIAEHGIQKIHPIQIKRLNELIAYRCEILAVYSEVNVPDMDSVAQSAQNKGLVLWYLSKKKHISIASESTPYIATTFLDVFIISILISIHIPTLELSRHIRKRIESKWNEWKWKNKQRFHTENDRQISNHSVNTWT